MKILLRCAIELCETMAENVESEPKLPTVFDDLGDKGSFGGFEGRCRDYDSDSDVELTG